jgi:GT2 family glycosyltransferase
MSHKTLGSVSIIVVTIGAKNYLKKCLYCIENQSYPAAQVIVIDNSLDSNFTEGIRYGFPWTEIYSSETNLFYAASLNKGIELSSGEFILCLNDDVFLGKDFIKEAVRGFSSSHAIGMVTGKILRNDKQTLDSTGLFLSVFRTAKERGYGNADKGRFQREGFVFGASGAAAFYRRKMLEEIKEDNEYFDEDLVMFYEDLDIAWRANRLGWKGYYMPKAIAYHVRGGSFRPVSGLNRPFARRYLDDKLHADLIKNRYIVMIKNQNPAALILHIIPFIIYDACQWACVFIFYPTAARNVFVNFKYFFNSAQKKRRAS